MQSLSHDLKAALMLSRLTTLHLTAALAEARSGHVTACELALNAALDTSRSIAAIFQVGNGSDSITLDTTQEPHMLSGTILEDGHLDGSSLLKS
jgi:hypothetical protein